MLNTLRERMLTNVKLTPLPCLRIVYRRTCNETGNFARMDIITAEIT